MREDEVYLSTKKWLVSRGFELLGGQPPRGTDRHPVIEIKSNSNRGKGSEHAFKPDLIAGRKDMLVILECKPQFDSTDLIKLREVIANRTRKVNLIVELDQRRIFTRHRLQQLRLSLDAGNPIQTCMSYGEPLVAINNVYALVHTSLQVEPDLYLGAEKMTDFPKLELEQ